MSAGARTPGSRWFLFPDRPEAELVLYCLPHSGGAASSFRAWLRAFPESVVVRPLQPPGRETRLDEPPVLDAAEIADVLAEERRPYAVYGHSLGALLGFEVIRELRRRCAPQPRRLFVGACRPPDEPDDLAQRLLVMSDSEFLDALIELGGTPAELRQSPELAQLMIRVLRADFGWLRDYRPAPEPPLDVPVTAFGGTTDVLAPADVVTGWARHTRAGFRFRPVPGGHFFLNAQLELVAAEIIRDLTAGRVPSAAAGRPD